MLVNFPQKITSVREGQPQIQSSLPYSEIVWPTKFLDFRGVLQVYATFSSQRFTKGEQNGGPQSKIGTTPASGVELSSRLSSVAKLGKNHNFQLQRLWSSSMKVGGRIGFEDAALSITRAYVSLVFFVLLKRISWITMGSLWLLFWAQ